MSNIVSYEEIDLSSSRTVSLTTTSKELSGSRLGLKRRTSFIITSLTAGVSVTVTKGDQVAVANAGAVLVQNQAMSESDDSAHRCWQGALQAVASAAGDVSIIEVFDK